MPAAVYDHTSNPVESYLSAVEILTNAFTVFSPGLGTPTYADSGATDHCFVQRSDFEDYKLYPSPRHGISANRGGIFSILGEGTVRRTVTVNGHTSHLIFRSALHMPELAVNLVSIGKFDDLGFSVTFKGGKVNFVDPSGRTFMIGEKQNRMYCLKLATTKAENQASGRTPIAATSDATVSATNEQLSLPKVLVATSLDKPVPIKVWHRRFGHAGLQLIRKLESKGLVDGLHIQGKSTVPGMCEDCIYGRQTTRPYDGTSEDIQVAGEKVYIDLWGPATVASLGGALYMMVFIDTGSSRLKGEYLTNKTGETTLLALKRYIPEAKRQTGNKVKTIQVDGGREWVNQSWTEYCQEMGISLTPVVPYAHAQNGVVERSIRMIFDGVRCLLAESDLPKSL